MYLRIARGRFAPATYEEVGRLLQEAAAVMRQLPGCQSVHNGGDRSHGTGVSVSLWETQEQAQMSRESLGEVVPRLQALGVQLEAPEVYEVVAQA
jgi:hypothetical protein